VCVSFQFFLVPAVSHQQSASHTLSLRVQVEKEDCSSSRRTIRETSDMSPPSLWWSCQPDHSYIWLWAKKSHSVTEIRLQLYDLSPMTWPRFSISALCLQFHLAKLWNQFKNLNTLKYMLRHRFPELKIFCSRGRSFPLTSADCAPLRSIPYSLVRHPALHTLASQAPH